MNTCEVVLEYDPALAFWDLYKHENNARLAMRYHALALLCDLTPVDDVTYILHVHEETILRWVERFNEEGIEHLKPKKSSGRPAKLSQEELSELKSDLLSSPRKLGYNFSNWYRRTICYHIKKKFGVKMTQNGIYALLDRMEFRLIVPRSKSPKADKKKD
ncbi:MAG: transposase [Candidatus Lokiarchaeota archaeon]|nr:transposase [Candidatus Lokiarchaeota archaeon]